MTLTKKINLQSKILLAVSGNKDMTSLSIANAIIKSTDVNITLKEVKEMAEDNRPFMNQILGANITTKLLNNI